jgi:hypothetical protein
LTCFLVTSPALADCDAPALSLENHDSAIHGTSVRKLHDGETLAPHAGAADSIITFGDYQWRLSTAPGGTEPVYMGFASKSTGKQLAESLVTGEFYLGTEEQAFVITDTAAYDLDGDAREDLIFFDVSTGANVYSGVVGIVGGRWVILIQPTCY